MKRDVALKILPQCFASAPLFFIRLGQEHGKAAVHYEGSAATRERVREPHPRHRCDTHWRDRPPRPHSIQTEAVCVAGASSQVMAVAGEHMRQTASRALRLSWRRSPATGTHAEWSAAIAQRLTGGRVDDLELDRDVFVRAVGAQALGHFTATHSSLAAVILIGCSAGSSSADISNLIVRGCRGARVISPLRSSPMIMLCTLGGVTRKKRCMSASAGGLR